MNNYTAKYDNYRKNNIFSDQRKLRRYKDFSDLLSQAPVYNREFQLLVLNSLSLAEVKELIADVLTYSMCVYGDNRGAKTKDDIYVMTRELYEATYQEFFAAQTVKQLADKLLQIVMVFPEIKPLYDENLNFELFLQIEKKSRRLAKERAKTRKA
jgi:hypothetical protein